MVLKSQVDPQFLFNNFSILSDLIDEDPKAAGVFWTISQRYIATN